MPELPEVETVRLGLAPVLVGHVLTRISQRRANLRIPFPKEFVARLTGRTVVDLRRRAKYLLAHFDNDEILLMHLGMSGRFTIQDSGGDRRTFGPHDHVVFETDAGACIVYSDHRRFGLMTLLKKSQLESHTLLVSLGPEPLSRAFSATTFSSSLQGKRSPIKSALLDQRVVAGLGNIYVCETLFRAGVSPMRLSRTIKSPEAAKIVLEAKSVLRSAIKSGGSTLRDYKKADGNLGYFQHKFRVYGREAEKCTNTGCGGIVSRIVQAGRSTFYCAECQR
jgi:formamidopyrimidine-DNA glycosylase